MTVSSAAITTKSVCSDMPRNASPAARNPSGPAPVAMVITAVITFGRSASGGFVVRIPSTGALTRGPPSENAASTTRAAPQGILTASAHKGSGIHETFTVRRISYGEGVERVFPVNSPNIEKIEVEKNSEVGKARLYYLRDRTGKAAMAVKVKRYEEAKA